MNKVIKTKWPVRSVSVVVPVFNGAATLTELVDRLNLVLSEHARLYEIILVNDGSHDTSWEVITDLAAQDGNVHGINLMQNYGQHNALLAGVERARNDSIITIDDDLQHPPEEIPKLLEKLDEGFDVVYGKPINRCHNTWRNIGSKLLKVSLKVVLGAEMGQLSSAFRAFRSVMCRGFKNFTDASLSIDVLLSWSAARITQIPVQHHGDQFCKSGYTLSKLVRLSFNMVTGYSTLPLRIASSAGLLTAFFGAGLFIYVVIRRLIQTHYVPGFTFLAAEIALFAGLQLFAIGVIGEYIARLHFRTMGKPPYVIRETVGDLSDIKIETDEQLSNFSDQRLN